LTEIVANHPERARTAFSLIAQLQEETSIEFPSLKSLRIFDLSDQIIRNLLNDSRALSPEILNLLLEDAEVGKLRTVLDDIQDKMEDKLCPENIKQGYRSACTHLQKLIRHREYR